MKGRFRKGKKAAERVPGLWIVPPKQHTLSKRYIKFHNDRLDRTVRAVRVALIMASARMQIQMIAAQPIRHDRPPALALVDKALALVRVAQLTSLAITNIFNPPSDEGPF